MAIVGLITAALLLLWARSLITSDIVYWSRHGRHGQVWSNDSCVLAQWLIPASAPSDSPLTLQHASSAASFNTHLPLWRRVSPAGAQAHLIGLGKCGIAF